MQGMTLRDFCAFIEDRDPAPGSLFTGPRIRAVCVALRKHRLIGKPERRVTPTAAAWIVYAVLGAPATNFSTCAAWVADRMRDEKLNAPGMQAIPALASLLSDPEQAADVVSIAVNQAGPLVVFFKSYGPLVLPGKTRLPARADVGVMGICPGIRVLGLSEQLSFKTISEHG